MEIILKLELNVNPTLESAPAASVEWNLSDTTEDLRLAADEGRGPPKRPLRPPPDAENGLSDAVEDLRLAAEGGRGRGRGPPRARHVEKL